MKKLIPVLLIVLASCGKGNFNTSSQVISSKVFGGRSLGKDEKLAKVTVGVFNTKIKGICTGTIIGENMILTAAHCVENAGPKDLEIVFDKSIFSLKNRIPSAAIIIHEHYLHTKETVKNDVALIKLQENIRPGYEILNLAFSLSARPEKKSTVQVAGFGYSKIDFIRMGVGKLRTAEVEIEFFNHNEKLLILNQKNGKGTCQGDSGGGAFVEQEEHLVQIGIASFVHSKANSSKADCRSNSYFTNISYFYEWIEEARKKI